MDFGHYERLEVSGRGYERTYDLNGLYDVSSGYLGYIEGIWTNSSSNKGP